MWLLVFVAIDFLPKVREDVVLRRSLVASCENNLYALSGHDRDLIWSNSEDRSKSAASISVEMSVIVAVSYAIEEFRAEYVGA